uniref:Uncharacterized protein n=1 Tax=Rhizophora mucronata TaxID=61149 RepID=A0A2P2J0N2_RHIMU
MTSALPFFFRLIGCTCVCTWMSFRWGTLNVFAMLNCGEALMLLGVCFL